MYQHKEYPKMVYRNGVGKKVYSLGEERVFLGLKEPDTTQEPVQRPRGNKKKARGKSKKAEDIPSVSKPSEPPALEENTHDTQAH